MEKRKIPDLTPDTPDTRRTIAFFDQDHSLLNGSNEAIYGLQMVWEGLSRKRMVFLGAWYSMLYKLNLLPRDEVYRRVLNEMGRYDVLDMISMMDRGFEKYVMPRLFEGGSRIIREHRDAGHLTVIATASGEYIAERVRAQLCADDFIASPMPIDGGRFTGEGDIPMAFMHGKLEFATRYCANREVELSDCWFYTDSASDMPLLEAVGHPVMLNPQLGLRLAARGKGWPVLHFRKYAEFDAVHRPVSMKSPDLHRAVEYYEARRKA